MDQWSLGIFSTSDDASTDSARIFKAVFVPSSPRSDKMPVARYEHSRDCSRREPPLSATTVILPPGPLGRQPETPQVDSQKRRLISRLSREAGSSTKPYFWAWAAQFDQKGNGGNIRSAAQTHNEHETARLRSDARRSRQRTRAQSS